MPFLVIGGIDLIAFIVALAAIITLGALWVIIQPITKLLNYVHVPTFIPFVGGYGLGTAVNAGLQGAMQGVIQVYDGITHATAHWFWAFGVGIWHLVYKLVSTIADAKTWATNAYNAAGAAAADAISYSASAVTTAEQFATDAAAAATGAATGLFVQAIAHADAVGQDVLHDAESLYNQAIAATDGILSTAETYADAVGQDVLHDAESLYNQAVAAATGLFDTAEHDIAHLADVVNIDIDNLLDDATSIADAAAAAAGAAAIAATLAQVLPRVVALEAEATECLEPLCEALQPNLSALGKLAKDLQALETLGFLAIIAALVGEAVADPAAAADDVITLFSPVTTLASELVGAVVG